MEAAETTSNRFITDCEEADAVAVLFRIENNLYELEKRLEKKLDHLDEQLHGLLQVIDEHRPLLARAAALADPGAKVRAMLHPRRGRTDAVPEDS